MGYRRVTWCNTVYYMMPIQGDTYSKEASTNDLVDAVAD